MAKFFSLFPLSHGQSRKNSEEYPQVNAKRPAPKTPRPWAKSFPFAQVKPLVVGRGPIRLEALRAFEALGTQPPGMLLSQKDSVFTPRGQAPELRLLGRNSGRVHPIADYVASAQGRKEDCIGQILAIARKAHYTHLFAGYGFMAEDADFIRAIEQEGLGFIGPSSQVAQAAGAKDSAKALARSLDISICPGVDNVAALALLRQLKGQGKAAQALVNTARALGLALPAEWNAWNIAECAAWLEQASRECGKGLLQVAALREEAVFQAERLFAQQKGGRLRLKHVGGGGGKGQRLITSPQQAAEAVQELLREAQAMGANDNKRFLIERNIETTRHNEIQLLGNGKWCIALGGRDCSVQMHEQKLLELALSEETLRREAEAARHLGKTAQGAALERQAERLVEMEREAERFGLAVGLNSASTFECIVEGSAHYFMEMNTRIQVEHRVTEQIYALRFANPAQPEEAFQVTSLVQAMLWMAVHGERLPRPERIALANDGLEVRINATSDALNPHGGGELQAWSAPLAGELRDDQGLGLPHPDNSSFVPYRIAGAYDSNLALVIAQANSRRQSYAQMVEALRCMELRGEDLRTNRDFHQGLIAWLMGSEPWAMPETHFTQAWLAGVGGLAQQAAQLDLAALWAEGEGRTRRRRGSVAAGLLRQKRNLLLRPLERLFARPHLLAGWCAPTPLAWQNAEDRPSASQAARACYRYFGQAEVPTRQSTPRPLAELDALYRWLRLEAHPSTSAEASIWEEDATLLQEGLAFYAQAAERLQVSRFTQLAAWLEKPFPRKNAFGGAVDAALWGKMQAAHRGHQIGLEWLRLPWLLAEKSGFTQLTVDENLQPQLPKALYAPETQQTLSALLEGAPQVASDEIRAWTGGMFYARSAPDSPPYTSPGALVNKGDVLGLLEVMKMFNPVRAECSGVITERLVKEDGSTVGKGQLLFRLKPTDTAQIETPQKRNARSQEATRQMADALWPE